MQKHYGKETLRQVLYALEPIEEQFDPENPDYVVQKHKGYFHGWAEIPRKSPFDNFYYRESVALIEDEENGRVLPIPSCQVIFIKDTTEE